MLKKLLCAMLLLCVFMQNYAFAQMDNSLPGNFLSPEFWNTASVADVQEEIKNGANVNACAVEGAYTPLMFASLRNTHPEVIAFLIKNGAEVNTHNDDGWTSLMWASANTTNPEILEVLIKNGANVNAYDIDGWTAFMFASMNNTNLEVIATLIKNGADVNARTKNGLTPLMIASANTTNPEILELLIKNGANVNARGKYGKTALDHCQDNENIYDTPIYWEMKELMDK